VAAIRDHGSGLSKDGERCGKLRENRLGGNIPFSQILCVSRQNAFLKTESGFKHNCFEESSGERYWISGPKKRGGDRLYGGKIDIDEDARVEY
jgi:hypothetical protein